MSNKAAIGVLKETFCNFIKSQLKDRNELIGEYIRKVDELEESLRIANAEIDRLHSLIEIREQEKIFRDTRTMDMLDDN